MPNADTPTALGLPPLCYARQPETGATVLIVRGEPGYHPVETSLTPEQLNSALAVPPTGAQVEALLIGSMFGWQAAGADPVWHAAAPPAASDSTAEPLPLFPIVATWGSPGTCFQLEGQPPIERQSADDRLWDYAANHLGFYGYLRAANTCILRRVGVGLLDLSGRVWLTHYEGRVHPWEAADDAIATEATNMGRGL